MLNYETLLSSYDDKLTLMQWLKKVEKALAGASASSFEVIKTGNATLRFRINFEDGTYLESGDIVLQQGESVSSGEIRNGHLYLTLTNGQELDCGELFNGEIPNMQIRSLEVTGGLIVGDDANAAIGGDLVVHGLTEVQNLLAYGHVETETLTAAGDEISAQKPVVEVMTGYSYTPITIQNLVIEPVYIGAVKNGNKLTLVVAVNLTRTGLISVKCSVARLNLPQNIMNKLYTARVGSYDYLDNRVIQAWESNGSKVDLVSFIEKNPSNIIFSINAPALLNEGTKYYYRYEVTFLLSDNLAA